MIRLHRIFIVSYRLIKYSKEAMTFTYEMWAAILLSCFAIIYITEQHQKTYKQLIFLLSEITAVAIDSDNILV